MSNVLKKNLFYNSLISISQFIFPLITFPYVSRILGPSGLGSVNFIDSFTQYFTMFAALGVPMYGVREIAKVKNDEKKLNKVFSEIISIHFLSTLLFASVYLIAGLVIPNLKIHFDLVLVGVVIMFFNLMAAGWLFQGLEQFSYIASRSLIIRCLSIVFLFLFLRSNSTDFVYYSIMASGTILTSIANLVLLRKKVQFTLADLELKKHLRPLILILGSSLAVSIYILLDTIILGFYKGDEAVGLYSTALRIVRIPFAIFGAISGVMIPQISHAYSIQNLGYINLLANKSFAFLCVVGIPISTGMFVSSTFLVQTFAGNKFDGSILALQILSPVIFLVGLNNLFGIQLLAPMGKDKLLFRSVFVGMICSLLLNLILIPFLAHYGTAITMMLTECVVTVMAYNFVRKYIKLHLDSKLFIHCLAASLLFIPIAIGFRALNLPQLNTDILIIITCSLYYACFIWFFLKNEHVDSIKRQLVDRTLLKFNRKSA